MVYARGPIPSMSKPLFRSSALERLSSPERLDALMTVTPARAWLSLVAVFIVIAGATVWGLTGRVHDYVDGNGIMYRRGGLFEVQAAGAGQISSLRVGVGDSVDVGQEIARLAQPDLDQSIALAEARLRARLDAASAEAERRQLQLLRTQRDRLSAVRSPYKGRVIELLTDSGAIVQAGQAIVTLEQPDRPLDCYVFVPMAGKRIRPGMPVRVAPSGVSWEEYGYIAGTVSSISDAPISPAAMNVFLHNDTLVRQFSSQGAAYLVVVDLAEDPSTPSGLRWTSGAGPPLTFGSGTLVGATTTLREQAPITLVVPALRRWLGF